MWLSFVVNCNCVYKCKVVCVCLYIHVYTGIHVCTHNNINMHVFDVYVYKRVCDFISMSEVCASVHVVYVSCVLGYVGVCPCLWVLFFVDGYMYVYVFLYVYGLVCGYWFLYIYKYVYVFMYVYYVGNLGLV